MSARSHCVTCGIVAQAALRCSAVLRRTARIGCRSTLPQRVKSGSGDAATPPPRPAPLVDQPLDVRLHVLDRDAAVGPAARHFVDVDAELARHPAHRRRRRRRRRFGRGRGSAAGRAPRLMSTTLVAAIAAGGLRSDRRILHAGLVRPASTDPAPRRRAAASSLPSTVLDRRLGAGSAALRRRLRRLRGFRAVRPPSPALRLSPAPASARLRRGGCAGAFVVAEDRLADLDLVAGLDLDLFDRAGDRRRHFDRRLVGFELEDRLILGDRVARLDQDAQDVAGVDVLAELGECEVSHEDLSMLTADGTEDLRAPSTSASSAPASSPTRSPGCSSRD